MKKSIFITLILIVTAIHSFSQDAIYYKAEFLKTKHNAITGKFTIDQNAVDAINDIYTGDIDAVIAELNKNPFLTDMFVKQAGAGGVAFAAATLSKLGGLDVTKFANAIADVMIERSKEELNVAFFNRFKKFSEKNPEFQILFPKTTDNLSDLLSYSYPQMLPKLRQGFLDDIEQITYNLEAVLELPKYQKLLENFPEVKATIQTLRLIHKLERGEINAAEMIAEFASLSLWNHPDQSREFKNMASTVKFAALFSNSLRSKDTESIWITQEEAEKLVTDEIFTRLYLGLLYKQIENEGINYYLDPANPTKAAPLAAIFAKQKDNIILMQNRLMQFARVAEDVAEVYEEIKDKNAAKIKLTNDDYFNYINVSIDAVDYSLSLVKIFDSRLQVDDYLDIARKSNNLYKDIYTKQYTQAVTDALDILAKVQEMTSRKPLTEVAARSTEALDLSKAPKALENFVDGVRPFATFMGNMIEAEDEAGVKAALENAILPVGSSSIKKNTDCNISVQSYLGAYATTSTAASVSQNQWTDKFGVIAPIGVSFTPGFLSWRKAGSLSVFGSLIDLGAIVDYKLKKDSVVSSSGTNTSVVSKDYTIELGQLFSPGVYLVYGFPANLPLSLGFGAQYGPGLSEIDAAGSTTVGSPSWRWNFFLAVDMPFFTIKHKNKSRK